MSKPILIVNDREIPFPCGCAGIMLTYEHALRLANKPEGVYTVTFRDKAGNKEGSIVAGARIFIRPGTVINVENELL